MLKGCKFTDDGSLIRLINRTMTAYQAFERRKIKGLIVRLTIILIVQSIVVISFILGRDGNYVDVDWRLEVFGLTWI